MSAKQTLVGADIEALVRQVTAPRWQFWVGKARKAEARRLLIEAGESAVPALVEIAVSQERRPGTEGAIREILVGMDDRCTAALIDLAGKASDLDRMSFLASTFRDMGPRAKGAVPILSKWVTCDEDPRMAPMRHATGDAELDKHLWGAVVSGVSLETQATHFMTEGFLTACVRREAAGALRAMRQHARPCLDVLRNRIAVEKDEYTKEVLERAAKSIEYGYG